MRVVTSWRRVLTVPGAAVALALAAPLPSAHAAAPPSLGDISVSPASGNDLTVLTLLTTANCPVPSTNAFATLTGPGLPKDGTGIVLVPNTAIAALPRTQAGGLALPFNNTLRTLVDLLPDPPTLKGSYTLDIQCRAGARVKDLGDFTGTLVFDGHRGFTAHEPSGVPASSLVTVAPRTDPPIPAAGATGSPKALKSGQAASVQAAKPAARKTQGRGLGGAAPWLIGGGAVMAALGVASAIRSRRAARRETSRAKPKQKAAAR